MIRKILTHYAALLDECLPRFHHRSEGLATMGMIGNITEERSNKMVGRLNVERETSGGISAPVQRTGSGGYVRIQPPLLLNLNNVWTLLGRQYYPSVICKIRRLPLDAGEISTTGKTADKPVVEM